MLQGETNFEYRTKWIERWKISFCLQFLCKNVTTKSRQSLWTRGHHKSVSSQVNLSFGCLSRIWQASLCRDILKDAISSLGGYQAEVFDIQDVGERLSAVHKVKVKVFKWKVKVKVYPLCTRPRGKVSSTCARRWTPACTLRRSASWLWTRSLHSGRPKKIFPKSTMVVNEKSSLRELTIAVLMTHWDYIAPVFFFR